MLRVFLVPGLGCSDLGIIETGEVIWWDPSVFMLTHLGCMRLDAAGVNPGPPDGKQLGVDTNPQAYWQGVQATLRSQLDVAMWSITTLPYDWRLDLLTTAQQIATNIISTTDPSSPVTLVGHSQGGLICVLTWKLLVDAGKQSLVRRIITINSPFEGAYWPITWLTGAAATIAQMTDLYPTASRLQPFNPLFYTVSYLATIALTWPCLYWLWPSLLGEEAKADPNRAALYNASNFPSVTMPIQAQLDNARSNYKPLLHSNLTSPPYWVMTCVASDYLSTTMTLQTDKVPLNLGLVGTATTGDSIVGYLSQIKPGSKVVGVSGDHFSVPAGIAQSGLLASLITDPRGPLDPPTPPVFVNGPLPISVTNPPESDAVSGLKCLSGG